MEIDLTEVDNQEKTGPFWPGCQALALSASLFLAGCMGTGSSAVSALAIDPLTTSAISPLSAESEILSDETVIRDMVGGLSSEELSAPQPWSNTLTGSAGVASSFTILTDGEKTCRLFQTTRHSFDGVALFDGRACQRSDGGWDLVNLDRTGS